MISFETLSLFNYTAVGMHMYVPYCFDKNVRL